MSGRLSQTVRYGLRLELDIPDHVPANLASVLKRFLDGLIASFHSYDGVCPEAAVDRMSSLSGIPAGQVRDLLRCSQYAALGPRDLVACTTGGLQWNPEDNMLVACQIKINRRSDLVQPQISGRLFTVKPLS